MTRRDFLLILLSVGMLVGSTGLAEETPQPPKEGAASESPATINNPSAPARRGKLMNIKGEVTEVEPGANRIKIKEGAKEGNKEYVVNLTEKTIVTAGKMTKTVSEIRAGDKVVVRISEEDGKMTARSVRLAQPAEPPQAPPDKTPSPSDTGDTPKTGP